MFMYCAAEISIVSGSNVFVTSLAARIDEGRSVGCSLQPHSYVDAIKSYTLLIILSPRTVGKGLFVYVAKILSLSWK